ncbi:MAG TPA: hypothetical protein VIN73_07315 [Vicingaceae bacterium]
MNITYLLGAGASYEACPIWKEQGEKMIELASNYLSEEKKKFKDSKPRNLSESENILWDIGYFGNKALEFGTIDTYAKKLNINGSDTELQRLKLAVSIFFTLWESSNDNIKKRITKDSIEDYKAIDPRYISLISSIIDNSNSYNPRIKDNIKIVTWNYDLQFERAFKSFCLNHLDWKYVSEHLTFRVNEKNKELNVCHLNGYNGFYYTDKGNEVDFLERTESNKIEDILKEIGFTSKSADRGRLWINDHINYAWEDNKLAKKTREEARNIFSKTDILVIIGYSFPPFNKEIDSLLFNELKDRETEIYYQDINASDDFLKILTKDLNCKIHLIKDKKDHFYLPYDF